MSIKNDVFIYIVILLFVVPLPWLSAWFAVVIIHELCHYAAVILCGGRIEQVMVSIGGIYMRCSPMPEVKRVICILSGPLGGLILLIFHRIFPRVAICAWILSAYNLIPILPLDGGHILQILMKDSIWFYRTQRLLIPIVFLLAIFFLAKLGLGILPIIAAGILFLKYRNTPCKID